MGGIMMDTDGNIISDHNEVEAGCTKTDRSNSVYLYGLYYRWGVLETKISIDASLNEKVGLAIKDLDEDIVADLDIFLKFFLEEEFRLRAYNKFMKNRRHDG